MDGVKVLEQLYFPAERVGYREMLELRHNSTEKGGDCLGLGSLDVETNEARGRLCKHSDDNFWRIDSD